MIRAVGFVLASCGSAFACDTDGARLKSEVDDAPRVFIALQNVPLAQPFSAQIVICEPLVAQKVRVEAVMPAHQHGMNYMPQIKGQGHGVFDVNGMLFHMPGTWEVRVTIKFDDQVVPYTHTVSLK